MRLRVDKLCGLFLFALISTILPASCNKPVGSAASGYPITFYANAPSSAGFTWQPPPIFSTNPDNASIQTSYFTEGTVIDVYTPFAASGNTYAPKCNSTAVWIGWDTSPTATTPTYGASSPNLTMPGSAVELYGIWQ